MRHLKFTLRLSFVALFALSLLTPMLPAHTNVIADAGRAPAVGDKDDKEKRNDPPDPCDQLVEVPGNANGLRKRCEGNGSGGGAARGDFNGDGIADLAVGSPFEDQDGVNAVGGVNIIYGSSGGLTSASDQFLDEVDFGFGYSSNDHFGWALAAGNFNGDEFSDLAIGMPDRDSSGSSNVGQVLLIDGSGSGLSTGTARVLEVPQDDARGGRIGASLVWADFNDDGFGDLAIGAPNAEIFALFCTTRDAGAVHVFYGSDSGLRQFGRQTISQRPCGTTIGDAAESGDRFGFSLAAGDFDNDDAADLVVGIPGEDLGLFDKLDAGKVFLYAGFDDTGLDIVNERHDLSQDTPGVGGGAETGDQFGTTLVTGDFNGDDRDDLAVGIPFEDLLDNTANDGGAIQVFFAETSFLGVLIDPAADLFISQSNLPNVSVEAGDRFGWALASGNFDGDSFADLAVGSPGENINTIANAGIVNVLYGTANGPSTSRVQTWHQDIANIPNTAEAGDQFGYALSAWNYGKSSQSDLAIGVPFEDLFSSIANAQLDDAGLVIVIYGTSTGLTATSTNPAQSWHQDVSGINDVMQAGDRFGNALY